MTNDLMLENLYRVNLDGLDIASRECITKVINGLKDNIIEAAAKSNGKSNILKLYKSVKKLAIEKGYDKFSNVLNVNGRRVITDGVRAVELYDNLSNLDESDYDDDCNILDLIDSCANDGECYTLPNVRELKAMLKICKADFNASYSKYKPEVKYVYRVAENTPAYDITLLIQILEGMNTNGLYVCNGNKGCAYFDDGNVRAILLPVVNDDPSWTGVKYMTR